MDGQVEKKAKYLLYRPNTPDSSVSKCTSLWYSGEEVQNVNGQVLIVGAKRGISYDALPDYLKMKKVAKLPYPLL